MCVYWLIEVALPLPGWRIFSFSMCVYDLHAQGERGASHGQVSQKPPKFLSNYRLRLYRIPEQRASDQSQSHWIRQEVCSVQQYALCIDVNKYLPPSSWTVFGSVNRGFRLPSRQVFVPSKKDRHIYLAIKTKVGRVPKPYSASAMFVRSYWTYLHCEINSKIDVIFLEESTKWVTPW